MPGPVADYHAEFEDDCGVCHAPLDDEPQYKLCVACHESVGTDLVDKRGLHGKHPKVSTSECQSCHREHKGRDAKTLEFDWANFDHRATDFHLVAAHADVTCSKCHIDDAPKTAAPNECASCHGKEDPHQGQLGTQCDSCHWQSDWAATAFNHSDTGFALHGLHARLTCSDCHKDKTFSDAAGECASCHDKDDPHNAAFGSSCEQCHGTNSWKISGFNHAQQTGFALDGQHATLSCASCHTNSSPLQNSTCQSCHAKDDIHAGSFGSDCASCHSSISWRKTEFEHNAFPLIGSHAELSCAACHTQPGTKLGTTCHQCHDDPHEQQLGQTCERCHRQSDWKNNLSFNHDFTHFPLLGKHALLGCNDCHASARFHDASSSCQSCHAQDDIHEGALGSECQQCHNPADWHHTRFDHAAVADFPLSGAHQNATCESCHERPNFMRATNAAQCVQCHQQDDPHNGQFGNNCAQCHSTDSFRTARP